MLCLEQCPALPSGFPEADLRRCQVTSDSAICRGLVELCRNQFPAAQGLQRPVPVRFITSPSSLGPGSARGARAQESSLVCCHLFPCTGRMPGPHLHPLMAFLSFPSVARMCQDSQQPRKPAAAMGTLQRARTLVLRVLLMLTGGPLTPQSPGPAVSKMLDASELL